MSITQATPVVAPPRDPVRAHLEGLRAAIDEIERHGPQLQRWGRELAARLSGGARLLVAGNGGSAAEAQHLTAELVGRYQHDRPAYSALALSAETSSVTAIGNDYGFDEVFARQVRAHAREGDVVLLLSTSGASPNLLRAAQTARALRAAVWALTGAGPNPLSELSDESICIQAPSPHVQECHLAAIHAVCCVFDEQVGREGAA